VAFFFKALGIAAEILFVFHKKIAAESPTRFDRLSAGAGNALIIIINNFKLHPPEIGQEYDN